MVEESFHRRKVFDRCISQIGNKYAMVDVIAKRAYDLANGAAPMLVTRSKNPHIVAAEEVAAGKIRITLPRRDEDDDNEGFA